MGAETSSTVERAMISTIAAAVRHPWMVALTTLSTAGTLALGNLKRWTSISKRQSKSSTTTGTEEKTDTVELPQPKIEDLTKLTGNPTMMWDIPLPGADRCLVAISGNVGYIKYTGRDGKLFKRESTFWQPWHPEEVYRKHAASIALSDALRVNPPKYNEVFNHLYSKYLEAVVMNEGMR
jgi:hypothetical protein